MATLIKKILNSRFKYKLILFLFLFVFLFIGKYYAYVYKFNIYKSLVLTTIDLPIKEFKNIKNRYPKSQEEFLEFISSNVPDRDYELIGYLKSLNFGFIKKDNSIIVYEFGFDKTDDKGELIYIVNDEMTFIKSLFIKGDVLLYKNEGKIRVNLIEDKRPIPPKWEDIKDSVLSLEK